MTRTATIAAAAACTLLAVALAAASATDRATGTTETALFVALAVVFAVLAQVLPVLVHSAWRWPVWGAVMLVTLQSHVSLMTNAQHRAGADRAALVATTTTTKAITAELDSITARPLATVAAQVATATAKAAAATAGVASCTAKTGATPRTCAASNLAATRATAQLDALRIEQRQAERADQLRRQLVDESTALDARRTEAAADPLTALLSSATGTHSTTAATLLAALASSLLELCGLLLWREVRRQSDQDTTDTFLHHLNATTSTPTPTTAARHHEHAHAHAQHHTNEHPAQTPTGGPADRRVRPAADADRTAGVRRMAGAVTAADVALGKTDPWPAHPNRDGSPDARPGDTGRPGSPGTGRERRDAAVRAGTHARTPA